MDAILLAAGQGKRFGGDNRWVCKVLIEVAGQCLLDRHLDALFAGGVDRVHVVVGFEAARIEARLDRVGRGRAVDLVRNERWKEGSLHSLYTARGHLAAPGGCLVMDADVLYDPSLIASLAASREPNGLLFDGGFVDEEMKVGVVDGRAVILGKKIRAEDYEAIGRGPGFYKVDPEAGRAFAGVLEAMVAEGLSGLEYEDAFNRLFEERPFALVDVAGRAWTEIDNLVDLARAENEIMPRLASPA
jgi:choline kinase